MSLDLNDPRLTAYALGELDEREAAILEAELDGSPDGQRALAEIRRTAELLRGALEAEPAPQLSGAARAQIIDAAASAIGTPSAASTASDSHTPAPARPALTNPASPAARRTAWLRRYRAPLGVAGIAVVAAALLVPAVRVARESGRGTVAAVDRNGDGSISDQEQLAMLVDEFNVRVSEQRYAEAETLAERAQQLAPEGPVARQMSLQVDFARRKANGEALQLDASAAPANGEAVRSWERLKPPGSVADKSTPEHGAYYLTDDIGYTSPAAELEVGELAGGQKDQPAKAEAAGESQSVVTAPAAPVSGDEAAPLVTESLADHDRRGYQSGGSKLAPTATLPAQQQQGGGQQPPASSLDLYYAGQGQNSQSERRLKSESMFGRQAGKPVAGGSLGLAPARESARGRTPQDEDYDAPDVQNILGAKLVGDLAQQQQANGQNRDDANTFQLDVAGQDQKQQWGMQKDRLGRASKLALMEQELAAREARVSTRGVATDGRIEELKRRIAEYKTPEPEHNTEAYDAITENAFQAVMQQPLSTFSIDVDTASYANVRRFLNQGSLPPRGAVRIEELINYFRYDYVGPQAKDAKYGEQNAYAPTASDPFAVHADVAVCPWAPEHRLVRIGLKGREIPADNRPATNLVFLLDVSGSMQDQNKLPLVKEGMRMLVERLGENDRVAIVVYAGASGLVLPSTLGSHKDKILYALDQLEAGGSTNGASGIQLAYDTAAANLIKGGANRVILCTDGDFNVGITDQSELTDLITREAARGVFLSVLGFGMGNLKDSTLEKLADKGNGNYAYIDNAAEARKVLVEELSGTLVTIAKDVKIQIEFNPARVQSYRLIGYENRVLAKEDFNNDKKDAGEIGAGHTVTALYEVVPAGAAGQGGAVDKLEYQTEPGPSEAAAKSNDLLTLKLRYKEPDGSESKLLKFPVGDKVQQIGAAGDDFEFAAAVAAFGMLLRGSAHKGSASFAAVLELAQGGLGADKEGYRREFLELVKKAERLSGQYSPRQ